jgi:hypothetical protein
MFRETDREKLRRDLLDRARLDVRISGGAITGSASRDELDRWSDVDLAFGVREPDELLPTLEDFTTFMRRQHDAIDTVDVRREPWVYRVFLLPSTLQVDLAFAPASHFGALAPSFKLVFGSANEQRNPPAADEHELVGYAWLYALHVRSSIARGRPWQALYMLEQMRDRVLTLACVAAGLPTSEARGVDRLPATVLDPLERTIPASLADDDLHAAFAATADALAQQSSRVDRALAQRLDPVIRLLVATAARE